MECLRLCVVACPRPPCRAPSIRAGWGSRFAELWKPLRDNPLFLSISIVTFSTIYIDLMRSPESIVLCRDFWSCCRPDLQRQGG